MAFEEVFQDSLPTLSNCWKTAVPQLKGSFCPQSDVTDCEELIADIEDGLELGVQELVMLGDAVGLNVGVRVGVFVEVALWDGVTVGEAVGLLVAIGVDIALALGVGVGQGN